MEQIQEAINELQVMPKPAPTEWTQEKIDLVKRTICKGSSNDELELFIMQCRRTGLDPFARQIHAVKRWDSREKREVMTIQIAIDGFRLTAQRTGEYEGQTPPQWCDENGKWTDVWLKSSNPHAARVGVYRSGCREPFWGVVLWSSYVQTKDNKPTAFWARMGPEQLEKCAEAKAFRKGFPQELSGLYADEEMAPADEHRPRVIDPPVPEPEETTETGPENEIRQEITAADVEDPYAVVPKKPVSATAPAPQTAAPEDPREAYRALLQTVCNQHDLKPLHISGAITGYHGVGELRELKAKDATPERFIEVLREIKRALDENASRAELARKDSKYFGKQVRAQKALPEQPSGELPADFWAQQFGWQDALVAELATRQATDWKISVEEAAKRLDAMGISKLKTREDVIGFLRLNHYSSETQMLWRIAEAAAISMQDAYVMVCEAYGGHIAEDGKHLAKRVKEAIINTMTKIQGGTSNVQKAS